MCSLDPVAANGLLDSYDNYRQRFPHGVMDNPPTSSMLGERQPLNVGREDLGEV
jgi:hypothetical protein